MISAFYARWEWRASTLNPYYEGNSACFMIGDDTLIKETRENWLYGADDTGDLLSRDNLLSLVHRAGREWANLVSTASYGDGIIGRVRAANGQHH